MSKTIIAEGATHVFPDDATDAEIASALDAAHPAAPQAPRPGLWDKFTMGLGDVAKGIGQALAHNPPSEPYESTQDEFARHDLGQTLGPQVDQQVRQREQDWQARRKASGDTGFEWMRTAGNIAGAAPLMAALPGGAPESLLGAVGRGVASGVLNAGIQPVTSGDYGAEKAKQLGVGAATGGITSGAMYGLGKAVGGIGATPSASSLPTQDAIKAAAQRGYQQAEQSGVVISPQSFGQFANELPTQLRGYHPTVNEGAAKIVKMLQEEAGNGPMTLEKLDALRSVASGASVGRDLNEARIAGNITDKIDDFIDGLKPTDLAAGDAATAEKATGALTQARSLWRTYSKMKTISDIVDTGETLNDQNWVKGRFRALVKSSQFDRFTDEEQQAIASVAKTGNLEKAIKLIPWRGIQMASTYAEPLMQDAKINSLQNLIARSAAPSVSPVAQGGRQAFPLLGRGIQASGPLLGAGAGSTAYGLLSQ
jgi:hypothetical protein